MKRLLFLFLYTFFGAAVLLTIAGCADRTEKRDNPRDDSTPRYTTVVKDTVVAEKFPPLPINYDQTKVLKNLYVIDRNGVVLRQGPDERAPALGKYSFGTKLDIIGEQGEWIAVMDRVQRDYKAANGDASEVTRWEKVYVAKSKLGKQDKITISPKDLNIIVLQQFNGKDRYYENGHPLDQYLYLELIDEQTFLAAQKTAKDYMIKDTLSYKKNGPILELPLSNGKKLTFTDKDIDNELEASYSYMGHYDFLNAFAIQGNYWESSDVSLFDQKDGHLIVACEDYPYFSIDKKYLMTLHADPYESTGGFQLFHVKHGTVSPIISLTFKNWMPTYKQQLIFWGKDGYIYTAANHVNGYWSEEGSLSERCQFIRIRLIEPIL